MKLEMIHLYTDEVINVELGDNSQLARTRIKDQEALSYRVRDIKEMMDALRSLDELNIGEDVPEFEPAYGMEFFNDPDFKFDPPADKVIGHKSEEEEKKR